jgi:hypothetical protein
MIIIIRQEGGREEPRRSEQATISLILIHHTRSHHDAFYFDTPSFPLSFFPHSLSIMMPLLSDAML